MTTIRSNFGFVTLLIPVWVALLRSDWSEEFALMTMLPLYGLVGVAAIAGSYSWKQQTVASKIFLVLGITFLLYSLTPVYTNVSLSGEQS